MENITENQKQLIQININVPNYDLDSLIEKLWWACYKDDDGISPEERVFIVGVFQELAKNVKSN